MGQQLPPQTLPLGCVATPPPAPSALREACSFLDPHRDQLRANGTNTGDAEPTIPVRLPIARMRSPDAPKHPSIAIHNSPRMARSNNGRVGLIPLHIARLEYL